MTETKEDFTYFKETCTGIMDKRGCYIWEGSRVKVKYKTSIWGKKHTINFEGVVRFGRFQVGNTFSDFDVIGFYIESDEGYQHSLAEHHPNIEMICRKQPL